MKFKKNGSTQPTWFRIAQPKKCSPGTEDTKAHVCRQAHTHARRTILGWPLYGLPIAGSLASQCTAALAAGSRNGPSMGAEGPRCGRRNRSPWLGDLDPTSATRRLRARGQNAMVFGFGSTREGAWRAPPRLPYLAADRRRRGESVCVLSHH